jgi:putative membrane protein
MHAARWIALSASALALAACGQKTETSTTNMTVTNTVVTEDAPLPAASPGQSFANSAAASDAFEIATSTLAASQASSPAIKKFATAMIKAHTDSTAKLKAAAAAANPALTPDPTLTTDQQAKVEALKSLNGTDFDKSYASAQVDAHQLALDGLKTYAANGDVAQLKDFAAKLVPTVTAHLNMAKSLKP